MTLTTLAIVFLLLILLIAVVGQRLLSQKTVSMQTQNQAQCAVCRNMFEKTELIERQVSDITLLYFCKQCVEALYADTKVSRR